ncbi:MAG: hypothetical protein AB9869_02985 [Verrucomicrobiia bacterium]
MSELNPYQIPAGPELDQLIHLRVMEQSSPDCPPYSTDESAARRVLARLRYVSGHAVVVGRTSLRRHRYFARYETDPSDGTEVLADTKELAICRLALLQAIKH